MGYAFPALQLPTHRATHRQVIFSPRLSECSLPVTHPSTMERHIANALGWLSHTTDAFPAILDNARIAQQFLATYTQTSDVRYLQHAHAHLQACHEARRARYNELWDIPEDDLTEAEDEELFSYFQNSDNEFRLLTNAELQLSLALKCVVSV
jgi:hypothetical protein